jgi:hypothetical protein
LNVQIEGLNIVKIPFIDVIVGPGIVEKYHLLAINQVGIVVSPGEYPKLLLWII